MGNRQRVKYSTGRTTFLGILDYVQKVRWYTRLHSVRNVKTAGVPNESDGWPMTTKNISSQADVPACLSLINMCSINSSILQHLFKWWNDYSSSWLYLLLSGVSQMSLLQTQKQKKRKQTLQRLSFHGDLKEQTHDRSLYLRSISKWSTRMRKVSLSSTRTDQVEQISSYQRSEVIGDRL